MSTYLLLMSIVLVGFAGVPGLFLSRDGRAGERLFVGLMTVGGGCAVWAAAGILLAFGWSDGVSAVWPVPGGRLSIEVDAISAMFVLHIAILAVLGAWYGLEYWPQHSHRGNGRKLRTFYGAITAAMLLLVVAQNGILFLVGWEIMALAGFLLFSTEDEKPAVREASFIYLLATRAGTLCLFAMFVLIAAKSGTLDLRAWPGALASSAGNAIFVLGLCGFGMKAGIMPLHFWLPSAHANAPSHVSAFMSGALIKMGIYGLVRLTAASGVPPLWWGYVLIGAGIVSGILGVGFAIGQHDIKRLLAYHSVENIGIICIGLGLALLGRALGRLDIVALGVAGALLHVWNHGLFKALLFLSAGSVVHATGTREMDRLGGLWRQMPYTGLAFLVGAVAICGLPPLNGLVSEWLLYLGLFRTGTERAGPSIAGALAAPALALVGALAVACFVKVFGTLFLGSARTSDAQRAHECGPRMWAPMAVLGVTCLFIGLCAPLVGRVLNSAVLAWAGSSTGLTAQRLPDLNAIAPLMRVSAISAALLLAAVLFATWLSSREKTRGAETRVGTWDCGYAAPTVRMQYTSSSFAEMLVGLLAWALRPRTKPPQLTQIFPTAAAFQSHVPDTVLDLALRPSVALIARFLGSLRTLQHGNVHVYLLYLLATVIALLLWR